MSKPEGIPDQVWMQAGDYADELFTLDDYMHHEGRKVIARAMLASAEKDRVNCVGIALSFIEYGGDTHHGITMNPMADAQKIASAIRANKPK